MIFEKIDILKKGVKTFIVDKSLLFVIYDQYLECVELSTFQILFQIDVSASEIALIGPYILLQKEMKGEIYIYNLEGVFLEKLVGEFLLYKRVCFESKAFFPVMVEGQRMRDRFWCLFDAKNMDVQIGPNIPIPGFNLVYEGIGVHVGIPSQFIKAFNITTGDVVWEQSVKSIFNIPIEKSFHPKVSFHYPIYFKGMVIVSAEPNELLALDVLTGKIVWRAKIIYPMPICEYDGELFIVNQKSDFIILDAETGNEKKRVSDWVAYESYPSLKRIEIRGRKKIKVYKNIILAQGSISPELFFLSKNNVSVLAHLKMEVSEEVAMGKVEYANERLIVQTGRDTNNQESQLHFYKVIDSVIS